MTSAPLTTLLKDSWVLLTSLFIIGMSWGNLNSRMDYLETRMDTYETQTLEVLEQLRKDNLEIKVTQSVMQNDLAWIKEEIYTFKKVINED
tara:strand:- start:534 stop:806 length:273 start_codon:yes stop_codon:yes gene_type:complete